MRNITKENKKIERKKFFMYSGAAAFGIFALIKNPFKLLGRNNQSDEMSGQYAGKIKIAQNPNAVSRNTKLNNG